MLLFACLQDCLSPLPTYGFLEESIGLCGVHFHIPSTELNTVARTGRFPRSVWMSVLVNVYQGDFMKIVACR